MNYNDFMLGQNMARTSANSSASATINEWKEYSAKLKQKLDGAETETLFTNAKLDGLRAVIQAMESELRRLNPQSPLLQKPCRDEISAKKISEFLKPHGYDYNPQTYQVKKL